MSTVAASSSTISIPTSRRMELRIFSRSSAGMEDFDRILMISYPKRYAPVSEAAIFSSFTGGYWISISLEGRIPDPAEIDTEFIPVSTSTSEFFQGHFYPPTLLAVRPSWCSLFVVGV